MRPFDFFLTGTLLFAASGTDHHTHRHHTMLRSNIFEGDMKITERIARKHYRGVDVDRAIRQGKIVKEDEGSGRNLAILDQGIWRVNRDSGNNYWEVPYAFDSTYTEGDTTFSNLMDAQNQAQVHAHVVGLNAKMTGVKLVNRTSESHYITMGYYTSGCWSYVGNTDGVISPQGLNLQTGQFATCVTQDTVEHEILHALGAFHEQSRPDRDSYVTINFDNINATDHSQFTKRTDTNDQGVGYDYLSVMHYWKRAFAIDPAVDTITTLDPDMQNVIGFADEASASDLFQLELMYRCPDGPREYSSFCSTDCLCKLYEGECTADDQCEGSLICNDATFVPQSERIGDPTKLCTFANATLAPTEAPTRLPTVSPTTSPTASPTGAPLDSSSAPPTGSPTGSPTGATPTASPTVSPTGSPVTPTTTAPAPTASDRIEISTLGWVGIAIGATAGATMTVVPVVLVLIN
jgi:hypothetical protein